MPFQCLICKKTWKSSSEFNKHMTEHSIESFKCDVCEKHLKNRKSLSRHKQEVHSWKSLFKCILCQMSFHCHRYLKSHMVTHVTKETFKCKVCSKEFRTKVKMKRHWRKQHPEDMHACANGLFTSGNIETLDGHVSECTENFKKRSKNGGKRNCVFFCELCQTDFCNQEKLDSHLETHQPEEFIKKCSGGYTCLQCPSYRASTKFFLKKHVKEKHSRKVNLCNVCGRMFRMAKTLKKHLKVHTEEGFKCSVCSLEYKSYSCYAEHVRLHGVSHDCPVCFSSFALKEELERHLNKCHTVFSRNTCHICGKQFLNFCRFRNHVFKHTGQGHICRVCFQTFSDTDKLKEHMKDDHVQCKFCTLRLKNKGDEHMHLQLHKASIQKRKYGKNFPVELIMQNAEEHTQKLNYNKVEKRRKIAKRNKEEKAAKQDEKQHQLFEFLYCDLSDSKQREFLHDEVRRQRLRYCQQTDVHETDVTDTEVANSDNKDNGNITLDGYFINKELLTSLSESSVYGDAEVECTNFNFPISDIEIEIPQNTSAVKNVGNQTTYINEKKSVNKSVNGVSRERTTVTDSCDNYPDHKHEICVMLLDVRAQINTWLHISTDDCLNYNKRSAAEIRSEHNYCTNLVRGSRYRKTVSGLLSRESFSQPFRYDPDLEHSYSIASQPSLVQKDSPKGRTRYKGKIYKFPTMAGVSDSIHLHDKNSSVDAAADFYKQEKDLEFEAGISTCSYFEHVIEEKISL